MTVGEIQQLMEEWAPLDIAWERDNPGLQVGSPRSRVHGILVCLDVTDDVIAEARRRRANLIISHHPLLFRPLTSVTPLAGAGRQLTSLLRQDIALYSAHTNLDFASGGTSFALAARLGLRNVAVLHSPFKLDRKLVTFVPPDHAEAVATAMAAEGAGIIGNYRLCSFRAEGTGTFRGNEQSHPALGRAGKTERVREIRLEMLVPAAKVEAVVRALKKVHPYEEVAYDIYVLDNTHRGCGMGVRGTLPAPMTLGAFLGRIRRSLKIPVVRYTGDLRQRVQNIAACAGSGAELTGEAVRSGAEVFVTADIKYHGFQEFADRIAIVDAGHFETERPVVDAIVSYLQLKLERHGRYPRVLAARSLKNPVRYA
jgi:dinuclear metal center YbgI/SA1388 family protein